ncbi:hypothetical protein NL393_37380, partial [Klebsiella pneumoniae]|nr:hypothetical protein [Klebsiella pneumoniae]
RQHFPGVLGGRERLGVAAGIGVGCFRGSAPCRLELGVGGVGGNPQYLVEGGAIGVHRRVTTDSNSPTGSIVPPAFWMWTVPV